MRDLPVHGFSVKSVCPRSIPVFLDGVDSGTQTPSRMWTDCPQLMASGVVLGIISNPPGTHSVSRHQVWLCVWLSLAPFYSSMPFTLSWSIST